MIFFIYSAIFNAFISGLLGLVIILKNKKELINRLFFGFSMSVVFWALSYWQWMLASTASSAIFWVRLLSIGALFIPVFYFHWVVSFLRQNKKKKYFIYAIYVLSLIFLAFSFSDLFIKNVEPKFIFPFWPNPGILYNLFLFSTFLSLTIYTIIILIKAYKNKETKNKESIKYILLASIIGFGGGATNFFLWYNIPIFPYGNILVSLYPVALSMAIFKYQLFDIKVVATEFLTFLVWIFLLSRTLIAQNIQERLVNGGLFIIMVIFGILLIRSILKEVKHREELEKLTQKLEGLNKYKSELISIVAHQLKNPLAVVKGYSSLIGDGTIKDPNKITEVYQKIKLSTNKLIDLLNNLLDLGHIEDGKMHYDFGPINLNIMLSEIINDFQFAATQKKLSLIIEPYSQDAIISGDPYKLSQVFRNLIDNSIKYTEAGWVKTVISKESLSDGKDGIRIKVYDSGMGISQELLPKLFQRFQRGVEEKQILGSGLGLYISKQIVEDHSGKIWVESDGEGKGSSFIVELPIATTLNK